MAGKTCVVLGWASSTESNLTHHALRKRGAVVRWRRVMPYRDADGDFEVDPFDEEALREAVRGADILFFFAFVPRHKWPARQVWLYNVDSVRMVCLAAEAEGVRRMVYCGSILSLGRQASAAPVDASTPYQPDDTRTVVERSLFQGEMEVWRAAERGLPVSVVLAGWDHDRVCGDLLRFLRRGGATMPPMESAFIEGRDLLKALIDAADDARVGERIVRAGRNAAIATLAGEVAERDLLRPKIKVLTDWQTRILLKMPRWIASRWLFEPGMGRLLTRRDRYA